MKIDQGMVGLSILGLVLAIAYLALIYIGASLLKDIIENNKFGILLLVTSMAIMGAFIGKYVEKNCLKKAYSLKGRSDCRTDGIAAFMLFMFFSTIMFLVYWEYIR